MSIIVTQINKYGIIFGSDSNITSEKEVFKEDLKIFEIPKIKSGLCVAGSYSVGGELLSTWIPNFISNNENSYNNIQEFVKLLSQILEENMLPEEKTNMFIAQIAGYSNGHPEMWCLSNTTLENGEYSSGRNDFHYSEDLWNRDWVNNDLENIFNSNGLNYQIYVNGFTGGRVAFNVIRNFVDHYFVSIWSVKKFKFRPPQNLEEHEELVRMYINLVNSSFLISDYVPKIIGGRTQILKIINENI